jgi:hypothetical protein
MHGQAFMLRASLRDLGMGGGNAGGRIRGCSWDSALGGLLGRRRRSVIFPGYWQAAAFAPVHAGL